MSESRSSIIRVTGYSKGSTGVWYYDVEIPSQASSCHATYMVRRRYTDFKVLHTAVCTVDASCPLLPSKSTVWQKLTGLSPQLLRFRRDQFDYLLRYVQLHVEASSLVEYNAFLGRSPQSPLNAGYVSLREYTSPSWWNTLADSRKRRQEKKRKQKVAEWQLQSNIETAKQHNDADDDVVEFVEEEGLSEGSLVRLTEPVFHKMLETFDDEPQERYTEPDLSYYVLSGKEGNGSLNERHSIEFVRPPSPYMCTA